MTQPELFDQCLGALGGLQADREHDHVELFVDEAIILGGIDDIEAAVCALIDFGDARAHETHPVLVAGAFIILVEILAKGAHVHVKDRRLDVRRVLLGDDGLFDGIHAAHRGAVGVATLLIARADALQEGDPSRLFTVRETHHVALIGARR